jgi:hypothetical protein
MVTATLNLNADDVLNTVFGNGLKEINEETWPNSNG